VAARRRSRFRGRPAARHRAVITARARWAATGSGAVAFVLLAAALLVAPLPARAESGTVLRLAQFQSELPDVEIAVAPVADPGRGAVTATLHYGDVLPYRAVDPGDYLVTMKPAGSNDPPKVSRVVAVRGGTAYTVASVRHTVTPDDLGVFVDDLTPAPVGQSRMRVVNAVANAPTFDVRDAAGTIVSGLPPVQASPYQDVAPGPVRLTVGPPGGAGTELAPVTVAPNQVVSVVLTSGDGGPRASVVVDAGGPADVPRGPVHAGFGGTAGRPGGPVGSAVLLLLAAVAGATSLRLARGAR
jgi:hypothetical protein